MTQSAPRVITRNTMRIQPVSPIYPKKTRGLGQRPKPTRRASENRRSRSQKALITLIY